MKQLPRSSPLDELLPAEVVASRRMLRGWWTGSLIAGGVWSLAVVAGLVPFLINLVDHGWQAVVAPTSAVLLGPPIVWAVVRHLRRHRHRAASQLSGEWRRFPRDARWTSSLVLAEQMDRVVDGDPDTRDTLRRLVAALLAMFRELEALDQSIEADRQIAEQGGDVALHRELVELRNGRSEAVTRLIDAMRQLHLGLARRHAVPKKMRDDIAGLLDELEAEREVDGLVGLGARASKLLGEPI